MRCAARSGSPRRWPICGRGLDERRAIPAGQMRSSWWGDRIFIPGSAIEQPTAPFLANTAPLLEEECDILLLTGVSHLLDPPTLHWPGAWPCLAADYRPMDPG